MNSAKITPEIKEQIQETNKLGRWTCGSVNLLFGPCQNQLNRISFYQKPCGFHPHGCGINPELSILER
ncbi:MAG: hypothetical protein IPK61_17815 [Saprospiraceae bacterium]|nr:hypothetical protein [Saprospiraceae bacterium]